MLTGFLKVHLLTLVSRNEAGFIQNIWAEVRVVMIFHKTNGWLLIGAESVDAALQN